MSERASERMNVNQTEPAQCMFKSLFLVLFAMDLISHIFYTAAAAAAAAARMLSYDSQRETFLWHTAHSLVSSDRNFSSLFLLFFVSLFYFCFAHFGCMCTFYSNTDIDR